MKIALLSRFDADSPVFYVSYESLKVVFVHVLSAKHGQQPLKVSCLLATTFPNNGFLKKTFFFLELSVQLSFLPLVLLLLLFTVSGCMHLCCAAGEIIKMKTEKLYREVEHRKRMIRSVRKEEAVDFQTGSEDGCHHDDMRARPFACLFFFFVTVTTEVSVSVCQ